jgi:fatty acid desaturase
MAERWHDAEFARLGYRLADKDFIKGLKTYSFSHVLIGTVRVWVEITAAWCLALLLDPWFVIVSFVIVVAAQQTMATWVHEASHHNLFSDKKFNDLWANFFFGAPMGMNVAIYRDGHLTHHMNLSR